MKQNSKRRVARFLGIMALAACAGGVVGFLGAMHADSFSGVPAATTRPPASPPPGPMSMI